MSALSLPRHHYTSWTLIWRPLEWYVHEILGKALVQTSAGFNFPSLFHNLMTLVAILSLTKLKAIATCFLLMSWPGFPAHVGLSHCHYEY